MRDMPFIHDFSVLFVVVVVVTAKSLKRVGLQAIGNTTMITSAKFLLRPTTVLLSRRCISRTAILFDDLPYHLVVGLPALSPTMDQGTLSEWYVKEGDSFSAGDAIAKIETVRDPPSDFPGI